MPCHCPDFTTCRRKPAPHLEPGPKTMEWPRISLSWSLRRVGWHPGFGGPFHIFCFYPESFRCNLGEPMWPWQNPCESGCALKIFEYAHVPMVFGPQSLVVSHQVLLQDIVDLAGFGGVLQTWRDMLGTINAEIHDVLSGKNCRCSWEYYTHPHLSLSLTFSIG